MKNIKELREKTDAELLQEIKNLKEELFHLRLRKVTDVIESPAAIRKNRRDVARMYTILNERKTRGKIQTAKPK